MVGPEEGRSREDIRWTRVSTGGAEKAVNLRAGGVVRILVGDQNRRFVVKAVGKDIGDCLDRPGRNRDAARITGSTERRFEVVIPAY